MFRDPLWEVFSNALLWYFAGLVVYFNRTIQPETEKIDVDLQVEGK